MFGPVVYETMLFKDFSMFNYGGHFIQLSGTICAILVEGVLENICVLLFAWYLDDCKYILMSHAFICNRPMSR